MIHRAIDSPSWDTKIFRSADPSCVCKATHGFFGGGASVHRPRSSWAWARRWLSRFRLRPRPQWRRRWRSRRVVGRMRACWAVTREEAPGRGFLRSGCVFCLRFLCLHIWFGSVFWQPVRRPICRVCDTCCTDTAEKTKVMEMGQIYLIGNVAYVC